jgi:hypothetical protein
VNVASTKNGYIHQEAMRDGERVRRVCVIGSGIGIPVISV